MQISNAQRGHDARCSLVHCHGPARCLVAPLLEGIARHAVKQASIFTQMKKEMHAKHADGPECGMVVHGSDRGTAPWGAVPVRQPMSNLRVLRASPCICVRILACFAARRTLLGGDP